MTLDEHPVEQLRAWRVQQAGDRESFGSGYQQSGYVFTSEDGKPRHPAPR